MLRLVVLILDPVCNKANLSISGLIHTPCFNVTKSLFENLRLKMMSLIILDVLKIEVIQWIPDAAAYFIANLRKDLPL